MTDVLLCVGNSMMGDDGAGPLLAEMCAANPVGDWVVIDGGSAPENDIVAIRELRPERLLIVDATDMGLNPGEIRIVDPDDIAEMFMMTTHNMPLNYLIDQLKEDIGEVIFLGIQPDIVGFYYPMTQPIKDAVDRVAAVGKVIGEAKASALGADLAEHGGKGHQHPVLLFAKLLALHSPAGH